jgi:hypothetical protein
MTYYPNNYPQDHDRNPLMWLAKLLRKLWRML